MGHTGRHRYPVTACIVGVTAVCILSVPMLALGHTAEHATHISHLKQMYRRAKRQIARFDTRHEIARMAKQELMKTAPKDASERDRERRYMDVRGFRGGTAIPRLVASVAALTALGEPVDPGNYWGDYRNDSPIRWKRAAAIRGTNFFKGLIEQKLLMRRRTEGIIEALGLAQAHATLTGDSSQSMLFADQTRKYLEVFEWAECPLEIYGRGVRALRIDSKYQVPYPFGRFYLPNRRELGSQEIARRLLTLMEQHVATSQEERDHQRGLVAAFDAALVAAKKTAKPSEKHTPITARREDADRAVEDIEDRLPALNAAVEALRELAGES